MMPVSLDHHQCRERAEWFPAAVDLSHHHDFVWAFVGERTEKHAIHCSENRHVDSDTERECEGSSAHEPECPQERTGSALKIEATTIHNACGM